jgi:hypothetical protein
METLLEPQIRIIKTESYFVDGEWYSRVEYSQGEEDVFGPFDSKEEAEGLIY